MHRVHLLLFLATDLNASREIGKKYVSFVRAKGLSQPDESAAVQIYLAGASKDMCHLLALDKGLPIKLGFSERRRPVAHSRHQLALAQQLLRLISADVTDA